MTMDQNEAQNVGYFICRFMQPSSEAEFNSWIAIGSPILLQLDTMCGASNCTVILCDRIRTGLLTESSTGNYAMVTTQYLEIFLIKE